MDEILEIRFEWESFERDGITKEEHDRIIGFYSTSYNNAINYVKDLGLWSKSIKKIVLTNNYYQDVEGQAKEWNFSVQFAKHKEYYGVSKCLFNKNSDDPQYYIFFPMMFSPTDDSLWKSAVFIQLIHPFCMESLPQELNEWKEYPALYNIYDYIKYSITVWCPAIRAAKILKIELSSTENTLTHDQLFNFFARRLKKHLFDYNCDRDNTERISQFWDDFYVTFSNFILRSLQSKIDRESLEFDDKVLTVLVNDLLNEIDILDETFKKKSNYSIDNILNRSLKLFLYFNVEIKDYENKDSFYIHLTKNPKEYFKGVLVDTEPRIVCFMDILGFSQMIDEYESDETSTVLQDIQKAFAQALMILKDYNQYSPNKEQIEFLEYKTFSDNICISLPYFNTEVDFLSNFNLILTFVRGLQYSLMGLGFFTRGGVAMGSYYSDDNIIFSKAMIDAYFLESQKAKYPRILIDNKIIARLKGYDFKSIQYYGLDKSVLYDKGIAIVNPFELMSGTKQLLKNMFDISKVDEELGEYSNLLKTFITPLEDITMSQLDSYKNYDDDLLNKIFEIVNGNISLHKGDKRKLVKYLWLKIFINWINDKTKSKRFKYFQVH